MNYRISKGVVVSELYIGTDQHLYSVFIFTGPKIASDHDYKLWGETLSLIWERLLDLKLRTSEEHLQD
jgi:hypothetical protein